jgi:oligopeptide/dipeptide ABC transporter ATP-binding protein
MTGPATCDVSSIPLLEVRDLKTEVVRRGTAGRLAAVKGVSFELHRGHTLGIVGESGCGKSLTVLSIIRVLPMVARVVGGQILFDGQDLLCISEKSMAKLRGRRIAMIFQDPMMALDPLFAIGSQLAEPLHVHRNLSGVRLRQYMIELLSLVGISSPDTRLKQYPHEFSGGMLQRVVGAISLAGDPELLIADEPTSALDPTVQVQYLDLLEDLKRRNRLSLILVTHDFGVAARLCDDIMVMYAGQSVEKGPVDSIFDNPQHPYTQALLELVNPKDMGKNKSLSVIEGQPPDLSELFVGCTFYPRCSKAVPRCMAEEPPSISIAKNHVVKCWRSVE